MKHELHELFTFPQVDEMLTLYNQHFNKVCEPVYLDENSSDLDKTLASSKAFSEAIELVALKALEIVERDKIAKVKYYGK